MDNRAIGVFDSGLGGLTGVRELRHLMPEENIIYFGDTGRVPYGPRGKDTIIQYTRQDIAFLLSKNVKYIMAACGTVSSTFPPAEAAALPVPFCGVVGATARAAAWATRTRRVGVMGTPATIRSGSYEVLLRQLVPGVEITKQACPMLVPLVENGYIDHGNPVAMLLLEEYLAPMKAAEVDTLILGCTHYPLLKSMIAQIMGPDVALIDPGKVTAEAVKQDLALKGLRANRETGSAHYFVSDDPDGFISVADLFLGEYRGGPVEKIAIETY